MQPTPSGQIDQPVLPPTLHAASTAAPQWRNVMGSFLLGELDTGRGRARIRKGYVLVLIMLMWAAVDISLLQSADTTQCGAVPML